ncbi:hypothetical protein PPERSA_03579 [Pseudocohnilembus persalinus]|uniref:RRM domain-containing protein n=1 Tax=Pseudocohnilembus persalinus TaxID=266149 RepID=A0A0V0QPL7_PSEPJ|nr:hypothetical protein PPERSA_03579 [Pseudocohnilembus persalinus]|eukprot:KRX04339.1 hypothetical protein PPERSA_03579 [Pseudocohnilembus persalinus]
MSGLAGLPIPGHINQTANNQSANNSISNPQQQQPPSIQSLNQNQNQNPQNLSQSQSYIPPPYQPPHQNNQNNLPPPQYNNNNNQNNGANKQQQNFNHQPYQHNPYQQQQQLQQDQSQEGGLRGLQMPPELENKLKLKQPPKNKNSHNQHNSYNQHNQHNQQQSYHNQGPCSIKYPRLYVGKYGKGTTQKDILQIFKKYGKIVDHLIKDEFSFIEFANIYDAEKALQELDGTKIKGQRILVQESKPRNQQEAIKQGKPLPQEKSGNSRGGGAGGDRGNSRKQTQQSARLYVGRIAGAREHDLRNLFSQCGQIVDVMIAREGEYAFVEFSNTYSAHDAIERFNGFEFRGSRLLVEESKPRDSKKDKNNDQNGKNYNQKISSHRGGTSPSRGKSVAGARTVNSSHYAKIRGLPFNYKINETLEEVQKEVPDVLKQDVIYEFDICGKFTGSVYINLQKFPEKFKNLKNLEKLQLGKRYIEVIPVDDHDYQYGIDNNITSDPRINPISESETTKGYIRIRGLPYKCTIEQIQLLLKGFQIVDVKLLNNNERAAGECLVVFTSKEAAIHSLHWQNQQVEGRYVEITLSNEKEFENFKQNNFDIDIIKALTSKEEQRLQNDRNERIKQQQSRRKPSYDNRDNYRSRERSRDRSRNQRGDNKRTYNQRDNNRDRKNSYQDRERRPQYSQNYNEPPPPPQYDRNYPPQNQRPLQPQPQPQHQPPPYYPNPSHYPPQNQGPPIQPQHPPFPQQQQQPQQQQFGPPPIQQQQFGPPGGPVYYGAPPPNLPPMNYGPPPQQQQQQQFNNGMAGPPPGYQQGPPPANFKKNAFY